MSTENYFLFLLSSCIVIAIVIVMSTNNKMTEIEGDVDKNVSIGFHLVRLVTNENTTHVIGNVVKINTNYILKYFPISIFTFRPFTN